MIPRFRPHWISILFAGIALGGPDDDYIAVYRTLTRADSQQLQGRTTEARQSYQEAQEQLLTLHRAYPSWNEKVVGFRLRFIDEKLNELGPVPPGAAPAPPAPSQAVPLAPAGEVIDQFNRLNQEIGSLTRDKQTLEAKLREALSAQPAPIDPRELQQAVEKISLLQSTNQILVAHLDRQIAERKNLVEKVVADEAREALNEANRQLLAQRIAMANLTRERSDLDSEIKRLRDGELKGLRSENTTLKVQVGELKSESDRGRQIADLSSKMSALQQRLDAVQQENAMLVADKNLLEKQIGQFRSHQTEETSLRIRKLETDLAVARADASRQSVRVEQLNTALEKEKTAAGILQQDNQALIARVTALGNQLANAQKAEVALAAERAQRQELEAQLQSAEQRLAFAAPTGGSGSADDDPLNTSVDEAARNGEAGVLVAEVKRLQASVRDGRQREVRLQNLLVEAEQQRTQWLADKADLLAKMHPVETGSKSVQRGDNSNASLQKLEARVRELEKQRDELTRKLADAAANPDLQSTIVREAVPATPRENAVEFRLRKGL